MKHPYFNADSYVTDHNIKKRYWLDRLLKNSRVPFLWKYFGALMRSRKLALNGTYDYEEWGDSSIEIFEILERVGAEFHITGLENIEKLGGDPVVYISNHMSTLETMVLPGIIAPMQKVTFVVKDNLIKGNFFGPIMRSRNPIVVGRSNSREDLMVVLREGMSRLKDGISVILFPQSTRTVKLDPDMFNSLGVKLAGKAKVKVVPVAIKTDFWGNGKKVKELGKLDRNKPVHIKFGEPMEVVGNGKEQHDKIYDFIESHLNQWISEEKK
ncbi:1-acyl-sn-glycerol-3-phosphate acyltransferase [Prolixibacteraceae bacterium JC049]|nr:1-acyl-sn-glycerol-3-phosphate acyltransferase [Prolixibacteraceae bacterium JC049]